MARGYSASRLMWCWTRVGRRRALVVHGLASLLLAASAGTAQAGSIDSAEVLVRRCVNKARTDRGLAALVDSPILDRAARLHARNMVRWHFFGHTDPLGRGPDGRVAKFDPTGMFDGVGENIARAYSSVRAACAGWLSSPGHRENILDPDYTHIGGGYARSEHQRLYVQDFGIAAPAPTPTTPPDPELPDDSGALPDLLWPVWPRIDVSNTIARAAWVQHVT
jgi:hypothetical protein